MGNQYALTNLLLVGKRADLVHTKSGVVYTA